MSGGAKDFSRSSNDAPSAADLLAIGDTSRVAKGNQKVILSCIKMMDKGNVCNSVFSDKALCYMIPEHATYASVTFQQTAASERMCKWEQGVIDGFASTFQTLMETYEAQFLYVDNSLLAENPRMKKNGTAYAIEYSKEAITDFLVLYDGFIKFVTAEDALTKDAFSEQLPEIEIHLSNEMVISLDQKKSDRNAC